MNPLVPLDLPAPDAMGHGLAAEAVAHAAQGFGAKHVHVDQGDWWWDDGGGNWMKIFRFVDGRALLIGHDHEYSETYFAEAAEYFETAATDLLAGAPEWWTSLVRDKAARERMEWVGFAYGFETGEWWRAEYAADDGFDSLRPPVIRERALENLRETFPDATGAALQELFDAGPAVTVDQVIAVGVAPSSAPDAVAAAAAFAAPAQRR